MLFYPTDISHFRSFDFHLVSQLGSLWQKCNPDSRDQNLHKSRLCVFNQQTFSIFNLLAVTWSHNLDPCGKSVVLTIAIKIYIKVAYVFFYPTDIFHFPSICCHLGSQLGSSWQKCDPDKREQNSHKNCLCFFTLQAFPIFIPLAVTGCPNLDPCGKNVILTGAIGIHIKFVYVFLPNRHYPFSCLRLSLWVPTLVLVAKVWSWQVRYKFT